MSNEQKKKKGMNNRKSNAASYYVRIRMKT